jgi:hypothetical protein
VKSYYTKNTYRPKLSKPRLYKKKIGTGATKSSGGSSASGGATTDPSAYASLAGDPSFE